MTSPINFRVFSQPEQLFEAAAQEFVAAATKAVAARGSFRIALSGGSTPRELFALLVNRFSSLIPWDKVCFFWGDERHVPPDHADSNYRMAQEALLSRIPANPENIFRIHAENPDANIAAAQYEDVLKQFFHLKDREKPRFDLILLGMGSDGHTASLFPGSTALHKDASLVVANWVEKLQTYRITFTFPVLNNASEILFMVAGKDKATALKGVFDEASSAEQFPAKNVHPESGRLVWLVGEDAAGKISDTPGAPTNAPR